MSPNPDTITLSAEADEECLATGADLFVAVRGASFFSGDTALKKAREVAGLVASLLEVGIEESAIELRAVQADVSTGTLGNKTSSATYSLRIHNVPMLKVADAIGAVTSQKNADLLSTVWQYDNDEALRLRLLESALKRLQTKANLVAQTMGVSLIAIHSLSELFTDDETHRPDLDQAYGSAPGLSRARTRRVSADELGVAVAHRKRVYQTVQITYRVSVFLPT